MTNISHILKGLATAYFLQVATLEASTKYLYSELNGDMAWNNLKRYQRGGSPDKKKKKKSGIARANPQQQTLKKFLGIFDAD